MPAATPCASLPYPLPTDPPDVAGSIKRLAEATDAFLCNNEGKVVGEIFMFWDMAKGLPPGALVCDGSTFSPTTWPALNTFLGTNVLPDLRNKFPMGASSAAPARSTGGFPDATLVSHDHNSGAHTHGIAHGHALSIANHSISINDHGFGIPNHNIDHAHHHDVQATGSTTANIVMQQGGGDAILVSQTNHPLVGYGPYNVGQVVIDPPNQWTSNMMSGSAVHGHAGSWISGHVASVSAHSGSVGDFGGSSGAATASRTETVGQAATGRNLPPYAAVVFLIQAR